MLSTRQIPAAGALLALALAAPASAAVAPPHAVTVGYNNGPHIEGEGYGANQSLAITVLRRNDGGSGDVPIARATARTDALGNFIVNNPEPTEPGDVVSCWTARTVEILPGDTVSIDPPVGATDTMVVQNVTAQAPTQSGSEIIMRGTAADPSGRPTRVSETSAGLFAEGRWESTRALSGERVLVSDAVAFDAPGATSWTARFIGLSERDRAVALGGAGASASVGDAAETATTTYEVGGELGPLNAPCTAPLARNAVTSAAASGPRGDVVNGGATGLNVSGLVQGNANSVRLVVNDADESTPAIDVPASLGSPAEGSRQWSVGLSRAQLDGLRDGRLRLSGRYTLPNGTIAGVESAITKDTVGPLAVTASAPAGAYGGFVSTTLFSELGSRIHYTLDGTAPSGAGPVATTAFVLRRPTTITALAIDDAGNVGPTTAFRYAVDPNKLTAAQALRFAVRIRRGPARRSLAVARVQGLRFVLVLARGTRLMRVRVLRVDARGRRRTVQRSTRRVRRAGRYVLRLRSSSLRRKLRRGRYVLRVDAGPRRGAYGVSREVTFRLR
jgi:Chitobiase/beta-hexosaminidase C-terminal domain